MIRTSSEAGRRLALAQSESARLSATVARLESELKSIDPEKKETVAPSRTADTDRVCDLHGKKWFRRLDKYCYCLKCNRWWFAGERPTDENGELPADAPLTVQLVARLRKDATNSIGPQAIQAEQKQVERALNDDEPGW